MTKQTPEGRVVDLIDRRSRRVRLSMLMQQPWLIVTFGVFVFVGLIGASLYYYLSLPPTILRFAVGPPTSEDAHLVQALAQQFVRDRAGIQLTPVIVEGATVAAQAIETNRADIAIVRRDISFPQNGQAIAELRESFVAVIVPAAGSWATGRSKAAQIKQGKKAGASKLIENIDDLEGHRIGVVGRNPANTNVLEVVLNQYKIGPEKVTVVPLDPHDIDGSLRENPVDVIFAIGPVTGPVLADAIAASTSGKTQPTLLKIGASEAIAARHTVFESAEIKAGVLGGQSPLPEQAVETISFKHYIVGRSDLSEHTAAEFTRLLFAARQALSGEYPTFAKIERPDTDPDATVPAHPGAVAFLDKDQKTFFEKYSDSIYFGLMLISGLGSALTWLASHARAADRSKRLKTLDRLLEIVRLVRQAETVDELLKLRDEADAVLGQVIDDVDTKKIDETGLMAFSLALDQVQLAISDQRSALTGTVAPIIPLTPSWPPSKVQFSLVPPIPEV